MAFLSTLDSPIVLSCGRTLMARNSGPIQMDMSPLQARTTSWIELHGLRFYVEAGVDEGLELDTIFGKTEYGMLIDAQISIGHYNITEDYTALAMLNPRVQSLYRRMSQAYIVTGEEEDRLGLTTNGVDWRFPRPMLVPPGVVMSINLQRRSALSSVDSYTSTFSVSAAVYGRKLASKPKSRITQIPYVACFQPKANSAATVPTSFSNQFQVKAQPKFENPFANKGLFVERFICRAFGSDAVTDWASMPRILISDSRRYEIIDQTYPQPQRAPGAASLVPVAYPGGDIPQGTVNAPTIFSRTWQSWRINQTLDPKQYYEVQVRQQQQTPPADTDDPIPWVSMIGSREERV